MSVSAVFTVEGAVVGEGQQLPLDPLSNLSPILTLAKYLVLRLGGQYPFQKGKAPSQSAQSTKLLQEAGATHRNPLLTKLKAYSLWVDYLARQLELKKLIRFGEEFYFQVQLDRSQADSLAMKETGLSPSFQQFLRQKLNLADLPDNKTTVLLIIFKSNYKKDQQPHIPLQAIFSSLYFDNQTWRTFQAGVGEFPTPQDYRQADVVIIPGSSDSVLKTSPNQLRLQQDLFEAYKENPSLKIMGNCYGHQLVSLAFGGKCRRIDQFCYGSRMLAIQTLGQTKLGNSLGLKPQDTVMVQTISFHHDDVFQPPKGFLRLATCPFGYQGAEILISEDERVLTTQCHPEYGTGMMKCMKVKVEEDRLGQQVQQLESLREECLQPKLRALTSAFLGVALPYHQPLA